ncbi:FAD-binding oxidoreductase [uncultured Salinisphaera sp.]|uniref:FAD-binding oxidoreductase n=1 Tax=uncultured Salinisphaera sp. TaxID=359372 RepID=UPI0032B1304C
MRRWNGWGDDTVAKELPTTARAFLESRLGRGQVPPDESLANACAQVPESRLAGIPGFDCSAEARLRHAHGQSFADWAALRHGHVGPFPDAVACPETHEQTRSVVDAAREAGAVVIPYGGGTSVVGHLKVVDDGRPVLSVDMSRHARLLDIDVINRTARIGAGAAGPVLEAQLRAHGFMLGHYPQSFDYSTLGGWVVTRSAGQQSRRYGRIENLLNGARLVCPKTDLDVGGAVASSAGPDLRQLVLGSEGRLGIVTEAAVHIMPVAEREAFHAVFFADWPSALTAARTITQSGLAVSMLRVSNEEETDTQLRIAGHDSAIAWLRRYLGVRGIGNRPALMMIGVTGDRRQAYRLRADVLALARRAGGVHVGRAMGRIWAKNRFAGAYLRNGLWDAGFAVDTMETAVPWSQATTTMSAMQQAAHTALQAFDERALAFAHLSHVYGSGCSIYMTVVWRRGADYATDMGRWRALKQAVSRAIVDCGGTISHQHGVGTDHAPYLAAEKGEAGIDLIRAALAELDPQGMMNPHKLIAKQA